MEIKLNSPLDMHLHLRDGEMLGLTVPSSSKTFSGALVMPNLTPPLTSASSVLEYSGRIKEHSSGDVFTPYMTLFFKNSYTREFLHDIKDKILAVKLYTAGATTNSEDGISLPIGDDTLEVIGMLEELGIPLSVHGETTGFVLERETEFAAAYDELASSFPKLKIVMEHITTTTLAELLGRRENLFATITLHHLLITLDDVIGGALSPHNFCKPVAKSPRDREALRHLALSAHPKVMFGSDSAPHPRDKKESCCGAAGIFHAPFALQLLATIFEGAGKLENLQGFVSDNARAIYNIDPPPKTVVLEKKPFTIPKTCGGVVPFLGGSTLEWSIKEVS
ncbi:MAG: dihydroorotase [Thermodesulfobacteriota bacterium]